MQDRHSRRPAIARFTLNLGSKIDDSCGEKKGSRSSGGEIATKPQSGREALLLAADHWPLTTALLPLPSIAALEFLAQRSRNRRFV